MVVANQVRGETLDRLRDSLKSHDLDPAAQARAVLGYVLESVEVTSKRPQSVVPSTCPNCNSPTLNPRSPYCSEYCKDMAAFVRQFRSAVADGMIFDPERQLALGQKLWRIAGGGYPFRLTLALPSALKQVNKRTGGLCEICGNPAATYDHLGSG